MSASYIAYLDLLGTRGFCENEDVYYKNIVNFSNSVETLAPFLKDVGKIGMFSDCVYIECSDLGRLLYFLNELRMMLIGDELFFNAAVSYGELGVQSIGYELKENKSKKNKQNIFGVRFTNREIASIYCKQTNFRGVGIWLDPKIEDKVKESKYKIVKSLYYAKNEKTYFPKEYNDIPFLVTDENDEDCLNKWKREVLAIIFKTVYTSHCKSERYSVYYISLLINIIRCCDVYTLKWNRAEKRFEKMSLECELIYNFLLSCNKSLKTLIGLDSLCFAFLDLIYNSENCSDFDKISITEHFIDSFECLKSKYKYSLDATPIEPFTGNNRNHFINYCNSDMAMKFVDDVLDGIE